MSVTGLQYRVEPHALADRLRHDLGRILAWQFAVLGQGCTDHKGIVINFASDDEIQAASIPPPTPDGESGGFDLLGVYAVAAPVAGTCSGGARILVSPERIIRAARELREREVPAMSVDEVSRILLAGVVVHELAHAMMDGRSGPLQAVSGAGWPDPYTRRYGYVIEESLAEACVLVQDFSADERHVIRRFIASAPPAYRAGFRWLEAEDADPRHLMTTMRAWRDHKALDTTLLVRVPGLQAGMHSLRSLASALEQGGVPELPFDFRAAFSSDVERAIATGPGIDMDGLAQYHLEHRYGMPPNGDEPEDGCQQAACAWNRGRLRDRGAIREWLNGVGITQFRIEGDTVHVGGDVDISGRDLGYVPVRFGRVGGHFDCSGNRLRSLCQLPALVTGNVYCCNNAIGSLAGLYGVSRTIAGYLCLNGNQDLSHAPGVVEVNGLQLLVAPDAGLDTVNRHLGHPHAIFDCQAELIDAGHDRLASHGDCCDSPRDARA